MVKDSIQTVVGFDFGMKTIGIAVGQTITKTAQGLGTIKACQGSPDWQVIAKLLATWQPQALVVGIPIDMYSKESSITMAAKRFATKLQQRCLLPVFAIDEKLSSRAARWQLQAKAKRINKSMIDQLAAQLILQSWLNHQI